MKKRTKLSAEEARVQRVFIKSMVIVSCLAGVSSANADTAILFVSRPNQVIKLTDLNGDGDFLEFAETIVHAEGLPASLGALLMRDDRLFVAVQATGAILLIEDLNRDGDALDFGEVQTYAQLPGAPTLAGLSIEADQSLLAADSGTGTLYRVSDLTGDGDALDFGETIAVADGLVNPRAVAMRPDGKVLVSQHLAAVPVRILFDRNVDGDYFDFAENLSYAENLSGLDDLAAMDDRRSFVVRSSIGEVLWLNDQTGDDDVLDVNEILSYAPSFVAPVALSFDGESGFFVALQDPSGSIHHVSDLNGDGDALDFGEVVVVAQGLANIGRICRPVSTVVSTCVLGDVDRNGMVEFADIVPWVSMVLGFSPAGEFCAVDMNQDGVLNGRDIQAFVGILVP